MSKSSIAARPPRVKRPGIYSITNTVTGRIYVGCTNDLSKRWSSHRCKLRDGTHPNKAMQIDHDRYGLSAFTFAVLERCAMSDLDKQEQHWMYVYESDLTGYNVFTSHGTARQGREAPDAAQAPRNAWLKVFEKASDVSHL